MQPDDHAKGAARADLCRFLAACYYEPGPEFTEERLFESMADAARRLGADFAEGARRLGRHFADAGPDRLLLDYTRLFLGPIDILAKPYASVWLEPGNSGLMQDSTMAVQALYEEAGFEISGDFHEMPDHIAAELEFLYLLIHRQHQAQQSGDATAFAETDGLHRRFLHHHLGRWVAPFTAAMKSGAQEPFYRELAELTERFVSQETATAGGMT
jgi:putative dimethyl sulfoxide reductase chaperone